eukprot:gene18484-9065_t
MARTHAVGGAVGGGYEVLPGPTSATSGAVHAPHPIWRVQVALLGAQHLHGFDPVVPHSIRPLDTEKGLAAERCCTMDTRTIRSGERT